MDTWKKRVIEEKKSLDAKIQRLNHKIEEGRQPSRGYDYMDHQDFVDYRRLKQQFDLMCKYSAILNERIIRF